MAKRAGKGGLPENFDLKAYMAQQSKIQEDKKSKRPESPWNPSDDTLIPTTAEEVEAREEYYKENPEAYATIEEGLGKYDRNDGLVPNYAEEGRRRGRISRSMDPDFGPGWDVLDPAPTRGLGRNRAQKAAYNGRLMVLIIVMRDGSWIRYDGVQPGEWISFKSAPSTNDFVNWNLHAHPWRKTSAGELPPIPPVALRQGMQD